jgi:hypothetical protein
MHKCAPSSVPTGKNPSESDLVTMESMQSALNIQSSFLDMLHSTTAGHLPQSAQELCHAETTTSVSQLQAYHQATLVEQFTKNNDIEPSACQLIDRSP